MKFGSQIRTEHCCAQKYTLTSCSSETETETAPLSLCSWDNPWLRNQGPGNRLTPRIIISSLTHMRAHLYRDDVITILLAAQGVACFGKRCFRGKRQMTRRWMKIWPLKIHFAVQNNFFVHSSWASSASFWVVVSFITTLSLHYVVTLLALFCYALGPDDVRGYVTRAIHTLWQMKCGWLDSTQAGITC